MKAELLSAYVVSLRELRDRAPDVRLTALLIRMVVWRICRGFGLRPVIRLHARSRMRLEAAPGDHGVRTGVFLMRDRYEPSVRAAIDGFLHPGDIAFDIGANFGLWALRMAERVGPTGRVVAFEPAPDTLDALLENARLSGADNIEARQIALGAEAGKADLYIPADPGSASLASHDAGDDDGATTVVRVHVELLDNFWRAIGSPAVRLVKIDAEGAEPLVLRGAADFFATCRPVTCCEINPPRLRALGFDAAAVMDFFLLLNYRCMIWSHTTQQLAPRPAGDGGDMTEDVVFIPADQADPAIWGAPCESRP